MFRNIRNNLFVADVLMYGVSLCSMSAGAAKKFNIVET